MNLFKRKQVSGSGPILSSALVGNKAVYDSGMVSAYRPAIHVKTGVIGSLIARIQGLVTRATGKVPPSRTTEQGAASAASPTTYGLVLFQLRYERRAKISDCRQMVLDDPRARKATTMFAREAVRKGCTIAITTPGSKPGRRRRVPRGPGARRFAIADECAREVQNLVNANLFSWAWMLHVEGDLFVQAIVAGDDLVDAKRMPASSLERNTDDTDEFVDPCKAFSQVDVNSEQEVATFPLALMYHGRWAHIDGERYGESEIVAGRRMRALLELMEESQVRRRLARAALMRLWIIGSKEKPGLSDNVDEFKERNGFVGGSAEWSDPNNVTKDVFGNGLVDAKTLEGDGNLDNIADLEHYEETYATSLPTPGPIYNLNAKSVNRDVLNEIYRQWLNDTNTLSDAMTELVTWLMNLKLLLKGILPESVPYSVHFSESSIDTPGEIVQRILDLRQNVLGSGNNAIPDPLISRMKALQSIADIVDVDDITEEANEIEAELAALQMRREQEQTQQAQLKASPAPGSNVEGEPPDKSRLQQQKSQHKNSASQASIKGGDGRFFTRESLREITESFRAQMGLRK